MASVRIARIYVQEILEPLCTDKGASWSRIDDLSHLASLLLLLDITVSGPDHVLSRYRRQLLRSFDSRPDRKGLAG